MLSRSATKHVHAAVGALGYWFQAAGFQNDDAAWTPGLAYLTFDTDFEMAALEPNVALTAGAWWPEIGAFPKHDTYTLGQFRQLGGQLRLTVPVTVDATLSLVQGFGKYVDVALHYESEWTRDANLYQSTAVGRSYTNASHAYLTIIGGGRLE